MEFIQRKVPKNFNLFFIGDLHIGSSLFHEDGFDAFISAVRGTYADVAHNVVIGMGDFIEAIDTNDHRFDFDASDIRKIKPQLQMEFFIEKMRPIRKKIALLLYGNHEQKLMRYYDYVKGACDALKVPYGTYSSIVTFIGPKGMTSFKAFVTHGRGSVGSTADSPERRNANMVLQIKRKLGNKFGDCALMAFGHTHKLLVAKPDSSLFLTSDGERVNQQYTESPQAAAFIPRDLRWYINTGSLLRLYRRGVSGYAEHAMYDPIELGFAVARVRGGAITQIDKVFV